jgi:hypothetical protein
VQTVKVASLLNAAALSGLKFQVVVYRMQTSGAAGPNSCNPARPTLVGNKQVLVNIDHANVSFGIFNLSHDSSSIESATLHFGPGETLYANLRMFDTTGGAALPPTDLILLRGVPGAVGTQEGGTTPTPVISALSVLEVFRPPIGFTGNAYVFQAKAVGGQACSPTPLQYSWSQSNLPGGLALSATTGLISGTPTVGGAYTIQVGSNECPPGTDTAPFNLTLVTLPGLITQEATSPSGATVTYATPVTNHNDATDGPLTVSCTPSSGSTFALLPLVPGTKGRTTTVTCNASDLVGNSGTGTFTVKVEDTTPPVVLTPVAVPATIWTSQNKKVQVTVSGGPGAISDSASGVVSASYTVVDEYHLEDQTGSVAVGADGSYSFKVSLSGNRESSDKDGRTFQIFVSATDLAGNIGTSAPAIVTAINK